MAGARDHVHVLKAALLGDVEGRSEREQLLEVGTPQIGVDHVVTLVVDREDRVCAMGRSQVRVQPFPERFEVHVVVVLEERRDDVLHRLPQRLGELCDLDQHIALDRRHRIGDRGQRLGDDLQRGHHHHPVRTCLTEPREHVAIARAFDRVAERRQRRDLG